jgi:hypothetical protein
MHEFHDVMVAHQGVRGKINRREFTVEMTYSFQTPRRDATFEANPAEDDVETVILYVSHDKDGVFTKQELGAAADKPSKYVPLKAAISTVAAKNSTKAKIQHLELTSRPDVSVSNEVRTVLETFKCENIAHSEIRYGHKFVGTFNGVQFEFNVWTTKSGRLNAKAKKVRGVTRDRVNPVWDAPKAPPIPLKHKIDQVVEWVKTVEDGRLTEGQIAAGPSTFDELESDITAGVRKVAL